MCDSIKDNITQDTVIVPVMNGVSPGECVRTYLKQGMVLDSLIYIVAYAREDYAIVQTGMYADIHIGKNNPAEKELHAIKKVTELLKRAGIRCYAEENIEEAIWKKYCLNCAYNVLTAYYMTDVKGIRDYKERMEEYKQILKEAMAVARAKGIYLDDAYYQAQVQKIKSGLEEHASSSLKRDIEAGKANELSVFAGYLLEEAKKYNVQVPVSERCYQALKKR